MGHKVSGSVVFALLSASVSAQSNIDSAHQYSWTENCGWFNWRDVNGSVQGVRVLPDHLNGYIWSENMGWIRTGLGNGPYSNSTGPSSGVNINVVGDLSGFAWGENVGWINFDTASLGAQRARFDVVTRRFRGFVWGENIGWINLDDMTHYVAVPPACPGDANGDGTVTGADLSVLLAQFGGAVTSGTGADFNGDGSVNGADLSVLLANFGAVC